MHANDKALGRSWYTADSARLVCGPDWFRWELHWADGALVQGVEDNKDDAVAALNRYGFYQSTPTRSN